MLAVGKRYKPNDREDHDYDVSFVYEGYDLEGYRFSSLIYTLKEDNTIHDGIGTTIYSFDEFNKTQFLEVNDLIIEIGCSHDFKHYIGFTDQYHYCTKCNERK